MASTAAWSAAFSSPRPISRAEAIAAASVRRTASSPMFLSMLAASSHAPWLRPAAGQAGGLQSSQQPVRRARRPAVTPDAGMDGMPQREHHASQCYALRAPPVAGRAGSSQCYALRAPPVAGRAGSSQCYALRAPPVAGRAGSSQCYALRAPPVAGRAGSSTYPMHLVFESNLHARVGGDDLDVEQVVVSGRLEVLDARLEDRQHDAELLDLRVRQAQ